VTDFIRRERQTGVGTITLDRPDLHNAFDDHMMRDLTAAMREFSADPEVRVIVLAAQGRSFCAGADLNWMKRMVDYSFDENVTDAMVLADMLRSIRDAAKPVIARVQGAAFGGGVGLVAACDMAVACPDASFCLSEVKLGIIPAVISPYLLEKIGSGNARRYALSAERFGAAEAHRIGLVAQVEDGPEQMDAWLAKMTSRLARNSPAALAACKQLISEVNDAETGDVDRITCRHIAEIRVSTEGQDGLLAFLEKRSPRWLDEKS
jgi:methylglutaconyl-CoA hydratase